MREYSTMPERCTHQRFDRTYNAGMQDDWVCPACGELWSANMARADVETAIEKHRATLAQAETNSTSETEQSDESANKSVEDIGT